MEHTGKAGGSDQSGRHEFEIVKWTGGVNNDRVYYDVIIELRSEKRWKTRPLEQKNSRNREGVEKIVCIYNEISKT